MRYYNLIPRSSPAFQEKIAATTTYVAEYRHPTPFGALFDDGKPVRSILDDAIIVAVVCGDNAKTGSPARYDWSDVHDPKTLIETATALWTAKS